MTILGQPRSPEVLVMIPHMKCVPESLKLSVIRLRLSIL